MPAMATSSMPPVASFLYLAMKGSVAPPSRSCTAARTLFSSRDISYAIFWMY